MLVACVHAHDMSRRPLLRASPRFVAECQRPSTFRQAVLTATIVLLRALDWYGDPNPWQWQSAGAAATITDFLNTTKYPPSLAFLHVG